MSRANGSQVANGAPLMLFYLVQHGEAKPDQEDPARPLTDRGRADVARVGGAAARAGVKVGQIAHSGKLRAQQTAEILATDLRPARGLVQLGGLAPADDPETARHEAERATEPVMFVGHLPHLSRLASLLLVGDAGKEVIAFRMGGIVCLSREEHRWRLAWIVTPELVS